MDSTLLGKRLRELRKVNGFTQDYVASVLGVIRQTYSHYESGRRTPSPEAIYKLAGLYNISADDLLYLSINDLKYGNLDTIVIVCKRLNVTSLPLVR